MRALALLVLLAVVAADGRAAEPAPPGETTPADEPSRETPAGKDVPALDLERLLRPPAGGKPGAAQPQRYGGRDRQGWEGAFRDVRREIGELEARIDETQRRFREEGSAEWGFTPAGAGPGTDPETLRLRAELRRDRQSLDAARARLRDLEVEAALAGVPEEWTEPPRSEAQPSGVTPE